MSDDANAGGAAAGEEKLVVQTEGDAPDVGGEAGAETGLAALAEGADEPAAPVDWPEDWRERLAGRDEAAPRELKRFGSPGGVWKKLLNQEKVIRSGAHKVAP